MFASASTATTEAEIDLRAGGAAHASLAQLCEPINVALGLDVAGPAGAAIGLTSPTAGAASAVELLAPAAQDATALLFAGAPRFASGDDARPARIIGPDVSAGLDLRGGARVAVVVDGDEETVDCAGADPAATRPGEIVSGSTPRSASRRPDMTGTRSRCPRPPPARRARSRSSCWRPVMRRRRSSACSRARSPARTP